MAASAAVMMSMDDNNPTQDNLDNESHPSHVEDEPGGWAKLLSLNPAYPNHVRTRGTTHKREMLDIDWVLVKDIVDVGRKSSCVIQIKHPAVSGIHCEISNRGQGEVWIKDHSTNGTFINSAAIGKSKSVLLNDGDEIVLIKSTSERIGYKFLLQETAKKELNAAERKYKLCDTLGSGAFAQVRKCIDRETGCQYAMKIIDKKKFMLINSSGRLDNLLDEVNILKAANHIGIIKLIDAIETPTTLFVVLELVSGGDLFDRIVAQDGKGFTEEVARYMFDQMLQAVKYLHGQSIVHRDLKPENILMCTKEGNDIRISDFGLSRMLGPTSFMKTMCGTPQYLAPEILIESSGGDAAPKGYDKAVDLWSLGCILYILLSGLAPFSSRNDDQEGLRRLIREGRFSFPGPQWTRVSPAAKDLVRALLTVDPKKRMTIEQAERHEWMLAGQPAAAAAGAGAGAAAAAANKNKRKETASASPLDATGAAEKKGRAAGNGR